MIIVYRLTTLVTLVKDHFAVNEPTHTLKNNPAGRYWILHLYLKGLPEPSWEYSFLKQPSDTVVDVMFKPVK